tara:strand:+ start:405 stop:584 length:180 start_codon:yes stop_codon:yes gene_type:complete
MKKPEFKLLPCVFCTIGFNCYVAGHKVISATYQKITDKQSNQQNLVDQNQTEKVKFIKE